MNYIDLLVVTGAGRGIGKAIALDFASKGTVVLCISKSKNAEDTKNEIISSGGEAESLILDICDYENTEDAIKSWIKNKIYKKIGIVLAASILGPSGDFINCSLKDWDECLTTNILGNLAVLRGFLPRMLENKFGRIVAFAGGGSAYAYPVFNAYSASKTAMVRIVENINEDLKTKGDFSIVCIAPGAVETDMLSLVRKAGGEVKTTVNITEPVNFVYEFIVSQTCGFSGSFVHVRDNWIDYLNNNKKVGHDEQWKLRRINA